MERYFVSHTTLLTDRSTSVSLQMMESSTCTPHWSKMTSTACLSASCVASSFISGLIFASTSYTTNGSVYRPLRGVQTAEWFDHISHTSYDLPDWRWCRCLYPVLRMTTKEQHCTYVQYGMRLTALKLSVETWPHPALHT